MVEVKQLDIAITIKKKPDDDSDKFTLDTDIFA